MNTSELADISLGKRQSLPEELAAVIMRRIESGEFRPGDILPSEQNLADMFSVSRTVVREALARLKYEGVVESKRGSGPIVKGPGIDRGFIVNIDGISRQKLVDFFEFRIILEGEAAALAALRRTSNQLAELKMHLEGIQKAVENEESGNEPDFLFHRLIAGCAGNLYLGNFVKFLSAKIWIGVHRARWKSNQNPEMAQLVFAEHEAMLLAIEAGDPHAARAKAQQHLLQSARRQGLAPDESFLAR